MSINSITSYFLSFVDRHPNLWTFSAVAVALVSPWIVNWLNNKPKRSQLSVEETSVINQSNDESSYGASPFNVGRIIIKNKGKYKARLVEAYIEKIIFNKENRKDFFPVPLFWTHGQLNKGGATVRDIYPNQTVYLDVFNHVFDDSYVGDNSVLFAGAAGQGIDNLIRVNLGESVVLIKLYQESGQVDDIFLKLNWDGKETPTLAIIFHGYEN